MTGQLTNTSLNVCKCTRHAALFHKFFAIFQNCKRQICSIYKELIALLHTYAAAIRILAKVYIPISLITPLKLK